MKAVTFFLLIDFFTFINKYLKYKTMKKIYVPGSKSISNRVLVLSSLSDEPTVLKHLLHCDDTHFMRESLQNFGISFKDLPNGDLKVFPSKQLKGNDSQNFIGNAGTASRFLSAFSLIINDSFSLRGIDRMHERPFEDLFISLQKLGIKINSQGKKGFLPVQFISQNKLKNNTISISGKVSSQFISALLLVAPKMKQGLEIKIEDEIPSLPYVKMTLELLKIWNVKMEISKDFKYFKIFPGLESPQVFQIPADSSSASYPVAFSLLKNEVVSIENFGANTMQGDEKFLEIAKKMGAVVKKQKDQVLISPPLKRNSLGKINFTAMPDVSMTGMILAAVTEGYSEFHGLESLRVKECDRIEAMRLGLLALGVKIEIEGDIVKIWGQERLKVLDKNLIINSFDDHRIAMCFGLLRSIFNLNFEISDPTCVGKTWREFWLELADWNNQLRAVSSIIVKNDTDEFLIVRKPRKDHAWQFPQGGKESGETDKKAASRELAEECGKKINIKFLGEKPVGEYKYLFPNDFKRHDKNIEGAKVKFFRADLLEGRIEVDNNEIIDFSWVKKTDLVNFFEKDYLKVVLRFL